MGFRTHKNVELEDTLKPSEILMVLCYQFCSQQFDSLNDNFLSVLTELADLCETYGPLLEKHCMESASGNAKGVPAATITIINSRYLTFAGSEVLHDTWWGGSADKPETPPKTICQLVLPAAYMEVHAAHEAKHSSKDLTF
jgi:hypothetical protein